jgi:hypothetical protein
MLLGRANDLSDVELPIKIVLDRLNLNIPVMHPPIDSLDLSAQLERSERDDPVKLRHAIDEAPFIRARALTLKLEPSTSLSKEESIHKLPKFERPNILSPEADLEKLRILKVEPSKQMLNSDRFPPDLEKLLKLILLPVAIHKLDDILAFIEVLYFLNIWKDSPEPIRKTPRSEKLEPRCR